MRAFSKLLGFVRLALGLKAFLRETLSLDEAKAIVKHRMETRDASFLQMVERAIFLRRKSPYLQLFHFAGCELGDVRSLIEKEGLEGTLHKLMENGVYLTYEEFKGRKPTFRGSQTFNFRESDFDNPLITAHFQASTGGTHGCPVRVNVDLDHITQSAPQWALLFCEHNWLDSPLIYWTPSNTGMAHRHLMCAKFGKRFNKWFTFLYWGSIGERITASCVHNLIRLSAGLPRMEFVPLSDAYRIGEYLIQLRNQGWKPVLNTSPSVAVRICMVMRNRGISLEDVTFSVGGEPLTEARADTITGSGAKTVAIYGSSECGGIGAQCSNPFDVDDIHVFLDSFAVIQNSRHIGMARNGDALLFTALRPACPKVILNTEIGDSAVLESRACGCSFDDYGYFQHVKTIRSFEKLTGMGMTIRGSDIYHILEEVLPKKFGGAVGCYQVIEKQTQKGHVQYNLMISPEVGKVDEDAVLSFFFRELSKLSKEYRSMVTLWSQTGIFRILRNEPFNTVRGKVLPFLTLT